METATTTRRERVFYCRLHSHIFALWWAVWGRRNPRRWFPGYANPAQFTTLLIGISGGDYSETTEGVAMTTQLSFHDHNFSVVTHKNQIWLTASDIAAALQYADDKSVLRIHTRHADEFTDGMASVVNLTTRGVQRENRVFSLRGAHLIAMFARTPVAKEFRKWVLDILDKEVVEPLQQVSQASVSQNYAVITYFENSLPVACHPLMPGEVVMNPDSCLEHVIRSGYVVMPCDEAEKFTLGEIQKMIAIARQARDRWLQH
ncbi:Bro-N domain-containing protein [Enterobacter cloacae]|uniref:BRO-N domain-containing protein n=1 Tax=Enterobacter cloacae TaxID=550 RepID=UPI003B002B8A